MWKRSDSIRKDSLVRLPGRDEGGTRWPQGEGNLGYQTGLPVVRHWFCSGSGQCLEVPLSLLQEWRG